MYAKYKYELAKGNVRQISMAKMTMPELQKYLWNLYLIKYEIYISMFLFL